MSKYSLFILMAAYYINIDWLFIQGGYNVDFSEFLLTNIKYRSLDNALEL